MARFLDTEFARVINTYLWSSHCDEGLSGPWIPGPGEVCRASAHNSMSLCRNAIVLGLHQECVGDRSIAGWPALYAFALKKKKKCGCKFQALSLDFVTLLTWQSVPWAGKVRDSAPHPWEWRSCDLSAGRKDALRLIQEHWREGRSSQEAADQDGPGAAERHRARANLPPGQLPGEGSVSRQTGVFGCRRT